MATTIVGFRKHVNILSFVRLQPLEQLDHQCQVFFVPSPGF